MWTKNINTRVASDIAERLDVIARQNETLNLSITMYDQKTAEQFDLTDYTLRFSIQSGQTEVVSAEVGTGMTVTPAAGLIVIAKDEIAMGIPSGTYTYNIIASKLNYTKSWIVGQFSIVPQTQVAGQKDGRVSGGQTYVRIDNKDILVTISNN